MSHARAASAIVAIILLAGCSSPAATGTPVESGERPSTVAAASPSPVASEASVEQLADAILDGIAGEPDWPLEGFGSLWLLAVDSEEPSILRVDPGSNEVVATIPIGGRTCQGYTVSDDALWACTDDGAVRIDPETNAIVGRVAFEATNVKSRLAFGAGSVWAIGAEDDAPTSLVRIDPVTMTAASIPLGRGAATLAYGFDAVWVTAPQDGLLLRVDPTSGAVTEHVTDLARPWVVIAGPDSLWVTLFGDEDGSSDQITVVRVDPADGAILAEIATGSPSGRDGGLWAAEDAVWVRARDAFLTRIDPATNEVVSVIDGPVSSGDVTVAFGSVWATAGQALTVYRLSR